MHTDTFKGGQDFGYVKYKLSSVIDEPVERIVLTFNKKPLNDIYSICDMALKNKDIIDVDVIDEEN
jgi:hypothetical protein